VDEPTTGIGEDESAILLAYLERESEKRAILAVLHNQAQARHLGGQAALLAGGVIQEANTIPHFFDSPQSRAARSSSITLVHAPAPDADPDGLDDCVEPHSRCRSRHAAVATRQRSAGFLWLKRGVLAGTPRPGIVADLEHDLQALTRAGISVLISLTVRRWTGAAARAWHSACGLADSRHVRPGLDQAVALCRQIDAFIAKATPWPCTAARDSTHRTILACYLIWKAWKRSTHWMRRAASSRTGAIHRTGRISRRLRRISGETSRRRTTPARDRAHAEQCVSNHTETTRRL